MNNLAPIILFVYNRPDHTSLTLDALRRNELAADSELYVYSDAPKKDSARSAVDAVRALLDDVSGFKSVTVIKREENWGLAKSIIDGATSVVKKHGKVIVLEDDLVTSPYFLSFMNEALRAYEKRSDIVSITGFSFSLDVMDELSKTSDDLYLNVRPMSWSWATWKDRWEEVDWDVSDYKKFSSDKSAVNNFNRGGTDLANMLDRQMRGKLDSWYIRWCYHAYKIGAYTVYPKVSLINNAGHDNTGVHCVSDESNVYSHKQLNDKMVVDFPRDIQINQRVVSEFNEKFNLSYKSRIKQKIRKTFGV